MANPGRGRTLNTHSAFSKAAGELLSVSLKPAGDQNVETSYKAPYFSVRIWRVEILLPVGL